MEKKTETKHSVKNATFTIITQIFRWRPGSTHWKSSQSLEKSVNINKCWEKNSVKLYFNDQESILQAYIE